MMNSLELKEQVLENICAEGCKYVNRLLVSLKLQVEHKQLQQLNKTEQEWVLIQLSSLMQVYENSGKP